MARVGASRLAAAGVAALAVLAAGCATAPLGVHEPAGQRIALAPGAFKVWVVDSFGCGFCGPEPGKPDFTALLLGEEGQVVVVEYGRGLGEPNAPTYASGPDQWAPLLDPLFAGSTLYGERSGGTDADRPVHVVSILAYRLPEGDGKSVDAVVQSGLAHARTPKAVGDVTDCGRTLLEVKGEGATRAEILCDRDGGGGWGRVHEQMLALRDWASSEPSI